MWEFFRDFAHLPQKFQLHSGGIGAHFDIFQGQKTGYKLTILAIFDLPKGLFFDLEKWQNGHLYPPNGAEIFVGSARSYQKTPT